MKAAAFWCGHAAAAAAAPDCSKVLPSLLQSTCDSRICRASELRIHDKNMPVDEIDGKMAVAHFLSDFFVDYLCG